MYKTILVPLDGSRRAESILHHVEGLARFSRAKIILLTALEHKIRAGGEGVQSHLDEGELEQRTYKAKSYLADLSEKFKQKDIQSISHVIYGPAVEVITKVAEEENADLIAVASHGRTGLERVFYGSISAGLLQVVDRPLLLIRSRGMKVDSTIQWGKDVI
jgi:nucleotide-binding universal stress UspA family protein